MNTPDRRTLLQTAAALALARHAGADPGDVPPGPAMTRPRLATRSPGRPGQFDFLTGHWTIRNRRRKDGAWDQFEGEATCHGILGGVCSIEELRIPARNFSGMGLRLLDLKQQRWSDYWVNAAVGVMGPPPGLTGSFEDGAGIFESEEVDDQGVKLLYRSVWDRITPTSCRWQQGSSRDGGASWQVDWSMDWTRKA